MKLNDILEGENYILEGENYILEGEKRYFRGRKRKILIIHSFHGNRDAISLISLNLDYV